MQIFTQNQMLNALTVDQNLDLLKSTELSIQQKNHLSAPNVRRPLIILAVCPIIEKGARVHLDMFIMVKP